jgi:hypothetical protein
MSILKRPGWSNVINEMADAKAFGLTAKQKRVEQGTAYRVVRMLLADFLKTNGLIPKEARTVTAAEVNNIIAELGDDAVTQDVLGAWEQYAEQQLGSNATAEVQQEVDAVAQEIEDASQGQLATGAREAGGHTSRFIQDMQDKIKSVEDFLAVTQFPKGYRHMEPSGMGMDTDHQYVNQTGGGKAIRVLAKAPLRSKADLRSSQVVFQDGSEEYNISFDQNGKSKSQSVLYTGENEESGKECGCPADEDCEHMQTRYSSDVYVPESRKLSLRKQTILAEQARVQRYQHFSRMEQRYM